MTTLMPADLRAYARRDWRHIERLSRRDRARQPVQQKIAIAIALYEGARATLPGWPSEPVRRADFADHVRLKQLLARAPHVGAR